ncbi:hypothetical protein QGM71_10725 [Virgibacillus sp. C22-A2]|uniref:DUF2157 domain-containing protein n=1 Tax=Virgibacillus tibetensis TaxID=3042313 RepID=A0ABU6KHQ4_9BACI|nr:hypothetical protein [Virgibacillus sp. C22-A2]
MNLEQRKRIVKEELKQLEQADYIDKNVLTEVLEAHDQFYIDLAQKTQVIEERKKIEMTEPVAPSKPKKAKKALSAQEMRERNITWSLNLGVVLLLIGGLVLATSTWDTLVDWMKTGLVALVSVLFFGLAYFTMRVLDIKKTAFAFNVLGSLFLPIFILSAGYFELFGSYFSLFGEGRYLYGTVGSLLILPLYLFFSVKLGSRLFVWFSYVTLSVFAGFLIASFYLPIDGFYLGIMLFNGLLIIGYTYLKKHGRFPLFTREFVHYLQGNLILSTLLMIIFYNHELMYSFNLILTAVLYFSMIFVTNRREYHFIFTALLVYGSYQLIEFSVLHEVGAVAYALLGFIFLALPKFLKGSHSMEKVFRYTSAVVSACAFLYISFEGIVLTMNEPSVIMLIAYIIISLNFAFLAYRVSQKLFMYLSPVFLMAAFYEVVLLGQEAFGYSGLSLPMFFAGFFLYIVFGCLMRMSFFLPLKFSSRDIGGIVMVLCLMGSYMFKNWGQVGTMFLLLAVIALFMNHYEKRSVYTNSSIASWLHAISVGFAVIMYYDLIIGNGLIQYVALFEAERFVLAGLVVLLLSSIWRKMNQKDFNQNAFYTAHAFYFSGLLMTFTYMFNDQLRALIVLGGIGMAYLLYRKTNWLGMSHIVSVLSLVFYFTVLYAVHMQFTIQSDLFHSLQLVLGAVLLLGTGLIIGDKDRRLRRSFWWAGHLYFPISLLVTLLLYREIAFWAFLVATVIYGLSVLKVKPEWKITTFLYTSFTTSWIAISLAMDLLELDQHVHYSFLIVSILLIAAWYFGKEPWVRRIAYYTVVFSLIGVINFTAVFPYDSVLLSVTWLYIAGLLFVLYKEKWDIYNAIPLLVAYYALALYGLHYVEWEYFMLLAVAGLAVVYKVIGILLYDSIYQKAKGRMELPTIDWYTIVGFISLCSMYLLSTDDLWTKLLPGILISAAILIQRKRIPYLAEKWSIFSAVVFLIQPYYTVLMNIDLPALFERELYVLPWVILIIFLKRVTADSHKTLVNSIQWAVLVIVALLLIQDGMASNTIYDALIVGTLSLASILGGMKYQLKSFFLIGVGVLLLNVFLQTRPYWGNLPWWIYLLIAGSILITVASYNEWHKQKTADGKETLISIVNKKVIQKIKKWD